MNRKVRTADFVIGGWARRSRAIVLTAKPWARREFSLTALRRRFARCGKARG